MNTPTPSPEHPVGALTGSGMHPPAIGSIAMEARPAANDDADWLLHDDHGVNPLWMITITLGLLVGTMALFVATS